MIDVKTEEFSNRLASYMNFYFTIVIRRLKQNINQFVVVKWYTYVRKITGKS